MLSAKSKRGLPSDQRIWSASHARLRDAVRRQRIRCTGTLRRQQLEWFCVGQSSVEDRGGREWEKGQFHNVKRVRVVGKMDCFVMLNEWNWEERELEGSGQVNEAVVGLL